MSVIASAPSPTRPSRFPPLHLPDDVNLNEGERAAQEYAAAVEAHREAGPRVVDLRTARDGLHARQFPSPEVYAKVDSVVETPDAERQLRATLRLKNSAAALGSDGRAESASWAA